MNLEDPLKKHFRLLPPQEKALKKMGVEKIQDLLYYFPSRYSNTTESRAVKNINKGDDVTLFGKLRDLKIGKTFKGKVSKSSAIFYDDTSEIQVTWFNQPYIVKMIGENNLVKLSGKVSGYKDRLTMNNPKTEQVSYLPVATGESLFGKDAVSTIYPVYPESRGITSNWIYHAIQKVFKSGLLDNINDPIPEHILKTYSLPTLKTSLIWVHSPQKENDALSARKRFAFEEIFFLQLKRQLYRKTRNKKQSFKIQTAQHLVKKFTDRFAFELTASQKQSIGDILEDFKSGKPMARLLEGDVGSGKTAVAATTVYSVTMTPPDKTKNFGRLQTAYMVPTEILAKQQFENFISFFEHMNINIGLITGSGCYKFPSKIDPKKATKISRPQLLKWVANGEIPILVGTHALIQKSVNFKNLAYVIIDEQHRFGTMQRQMLARKDDFIPHLLSMTATPIPRTLALTIYGDLDLSLLNEMPAGRKPIITQIVTPHKRQETYELIREELNKGRQAYIICPRIDEPDPTKEMAIMAKSVKAEAKRIEDVVFPEFTVDIMHSKMKPQEKEDAMKRFEKGETKILVSTSVVEVGVNVPNATMIIIEGAERFGLAQLHQLRGRVIRSNHQAYAFVFSDTESQKSIDRLKALQTAKNGFELAEFDLQFRGTGDLYGKKQWGVSDLGMEAIRNIKMVEAARNEAHNLVEEDPTLKKYPAIKESLVNKKEVHLE